MNIMSLRKARINGLVEYVRGLKKPTDEYSIVHGYSYTSGLSTRTIREYVKVLKSIGLFKTYKTNPKNWREYIKLA